MQKQAQYTVRRIDGTPTGPSKSVGNERTFAYSAGDTFGICWYEFCPHEQKPLVGMKPGDKRVVTLTWDDGKPDSHKA